MMVHKEKKNKKFCFFDTLHSSNNKVRSPPNKIQKHQQQSSSTNNVVDGVQDKVHHSDLQLPRFMMIKITVSCLTVVPPSMPGSRASNAFLFLYPNFGFGFGCMRMLLAAKCVFECVCVCVIVVFNVYFKVHLNFVVFHFLWEVAASGWRSTSHFIKWHDHYCGILRA